VASLRLLNGTSLASFEVGIRWRGYFKFQNRWPFRDR
jgi:hypothetical protein